MIRKTGKKTRIHSGYAERLKICFIRSTDTGRMRAGNKSSASLAQKNLNDNWRHFMQSDNKKVYSDIDSLPRGSAPDTIIPGCMVLEGGAFRGLYGEGALDCLMQEGINLQCTIGVSAGACNGWHYVSGQIGRSARVNLGCRHDPRYVGAIAMKENAGLMGFKYFFEDYEKEYDDPFDLERFNRPDRRYIAIATNCRTGKPVCFEKGRCRKID